MRTAKYMKNCHTNIFHFLISGGFGIAISNGLLAQTPLELDQLVEKCIIPRYGFSDIEMEKFLPSWKGRNTASGLNALFDLHMDAQSDTDTLEACANLIRRHSLPKEQLPEVLRQRALVEAENDEEPWRLVYVLRQMPRLVDRKQHGHEVIPFIASFLDDKRITETWDRGPDAVPRQPRRVSDGATSALKFFMEEEGISEKYDSRFGDPGGEATWVRRDEVSRAVVRVLQENELLPGDFWERLGQSEAQVVAAGNASTPVEDVLPDQSPQFSKKPNVRLWVILGSVLLLLAILLYVKLRSKRLN